MKKQKINNGAKFVISGLTFAILSGCGVAPLTSKTDRQRDITMGQVSRMSADNISGPSVAVQSAKNLKGGRELADQEAFLQKNMPVSRRANAPFIGSVMVPATSEDKLPTIFSEPFTLDFSSDTNAQGSVSLAIAMARLSKLSGVPIRIQPDAYLDLSTPAKPVTAPVRAMPGVMGEPIPSPFSGNSPGVTGSMAVAPPVQISPRAESVTTTQANTVLNVDMRYAGTLAGYLNLVTDRLGLSWEYRDNTIVVMKFSTEMHEIFTFPGTQRFAFSSSGSGSGSGGGSGASNAASASLSVDESGDIAPLATIEKSITQMISDIPGSSIMRTDGSGRLMVKTSKEMQSRVRDYVKSENNAMRRQAQIQFDIYSITTDASDERGINWTAIIQKAGEAAQLKFGTPSSLTTTLSGNVSMNILAGNSISTLLGDTGLMLQAMNSNGYAAQHRPVSLLALNRQWGRISRLSTEYYLSETTPGPASSTGVGAPGLKTDKVTTGDQYVAMPQILDDNTILLKFGMSLSDLLGLFDVSVGSGNTQQKVQAPKITAVNAQFPVALRPGEVVAVTGLSRLVSTSSERKLSERVPMMFGGSEVVSYKREHFIVFIRPVLL